MLDSNDSLFIKLSYAEDFRVGSMRVWTLYERTCPGVANLPAMPFCTSITSAILEIEEYGRIAASGNDALRWRFVSELVAS